MPYPLAAPPLALTCWGFAELLFFIFTNDVQLITLYSLNRNETPRSYKYVYVICVFEIKF